MSIQNITDVNFISVTPDNIDEIGIYCIKDKKHPGYQKKVAWFQEKLNQGLRIIIARDQDQKQLGFIEYLPSESAWRPVKAKQYFFIQCIALFVKTAKNKTVGSELIGLCEKEAIEKGRRGVCVMSSDGSWMANKKIFERRGFELVDQKDRYELMVKKFEETAPQPRFHNWTAAQKNYQGWNLVYADQCPWHEKAVVALLESAAAHQVELQLHHLTTPQQAQKAPSGFGTFTLIKDGKVLADHYISKTRFENILKKEWT